MTQEKPSTNSARDRRASEPRLHTERLILLPLTAFDRAELREVFTLPAVRRYLWDDEVVSDTQVAEILETNEGLFAAGQPGIWAVRLKGESALSGFVGFWSFFEPPVRELLFGLVPAEWGRGLAFEAAQRVLEEEPDGQAVFATTDRPNRAAHRLLARLEFVEDHERQARTLAEDPSSAAVHYRLDGAAGEPSG